MKKPAWTKIKADYLKGIAPKDLAAKYDIDINKIYNKVDHDDWAKQKAEISAKVRNDVEAQITEITNLALGRLRDVLSDEEVRTGDIINAIGKAIEISGLKSSKQEITGNAFSVLINNKAVDIERDKV